MIAESSNHSYAASTTNLVKFPNSSVRSLSQPSSKFSSTFLVNDSNSITSSRPSSSKLAPIARALIADNSRTCQKLHTRLLSQRGYKCTVIDSVSEEIFEIVSNSLSNQDGTTSNKVEIVMMGGELQGSNVLTVTQRLRQEGYRGLVIIVTGTTNERDMKSLTACGADKVVAKPIKASLLTMIINDYKRFGSLSRSHVGTGDHNHRRLEHNSQKLFKEIMKNEQRHALVADDTASCRKIHKQLLSKMGFTVFDLDGNGDQVCHTVKKSILEATQHLHGPSHGHDDFHRLQEVVHHHELVHHHEELVHHQIHDSLRHRDGHAVDSRLPGQSHHPDSQHHIPHLSDSHHPDRPHPSDPTLASKPHFKQAPMSKHLNSVISNIREAITKHVGAATKVANRLREVFEEMDTDSDGHISHAEFKRAMHALQFDITDGDITEVMHHFDKNNNGALEYKELMLLVTGKVVETMEHESKTAHHHSAGDHHTVASTAVHPHHKRIGGGGSFDMIVMSGILKGTDSHVTVRRLRQLGFKGLIIVVTSKSNSEDISEFHECGSNAVILKPLTHQKLMGAFEESSPRLGGHPQSSSHNPHSSLESASDHQHGASAQTAIVPHYIAAFKKSKYMSNGNLGELRILMVDDSLQCCKINHNLLKEKNHSVIETDSGKVAVDMIKKSLLVASFGATNCTFDVVLLSGTISDMTGWEVAKLLRLDGFFGLILGLMHGPTSHDATKYREVGADGILTKPLSVDDFNQTIYDLCFAEEAILKKLKLAQLQQAENGDEGEEEDGADKLLKALKKSMNILIVDDNSVVLKSAEKILSHVGHRTLVASSAAEAVNHLKKADIDAAYGNTAAIIDLVLVGHILMGAGASKTIESIAHRRFKGVIIAMYSDVAPGEAAELKKAGAHVAVLQPLTIQKFNKALAVVKAAAHMRREGSSGADGERERSREGEGERDDVRGDAIEGGGVSGPGARKLFQKAMTSLKYRMSNKALTSTKLHPTHSAKSQVEHVGNESLIPDAGELHTDVSSEIDPAAATATAASAVASSVGSSTRTRVKSGKSFEKFSSMKSHIMDGIEESTEEQVTGNLDDLPLHPPNDADASAFVSCIDGEDSLVAPTSEYSAVRGDDDGADPGTVRLAIGAEETNNATSISGTGGAPFTDDGPFSEMSKTRTPHPAFLAGKGNVYSSAVSHNRSSHPSQISGKDSVHGLVSKPDYGNSDDKKIDNDGVAHSASRSQREGAPVMAMTRCEDFFAQRNDTWDSNSSDDDYDEFATALSSVDAGRGTVPADDSYHQQLHQHQQQQQQQQQQFDGRRSDMRRPLSPLLDSDATFQIMQDLTEARIRQRALATMQARGGSSGAAISSHALTRGVGLLAPMDVSDNRGQSLRSGYSLSGGSAAGRMMTGGTRMGPRQRGGPRHHGGARHHGGRDRMQTMTVAVPITSAAYGLDRVRDDSMTLGTATSRSHSLKTHFSEFSPVLSEMTQRAITNELGLNRESVTPMRKNVAVHFPGYNSDRTRASTSHATSRILEREKQNLTPEQLVDPQTKIAMKNGATATTSRFLASAAVNSHTYKNADEMVAKSPGLAVEAHNRDQFTLSRQQQDEVRMKKEKEMRRVIANSHSRTDPGLLSLGYNNMRMVVIVSDSNDEAKKSMHVGADEIAASRPQSRADTVGSVALVIPAAVVQQHTHLISPVTAAHAHSITHAPLPGITSPASGDAWLGQRDPITGLMKPMDNGDFEREMKALDLARYKRRGVSEDLKHVVLGRP